MTGLEFTRKLDEPGSLKTLCGEPGYIAPEQLERWPAYGFACDIWSIGVVVYELLGGCHPFEGDWDQIFDQTRTGQYSFYPNLFRKISFSARELVARLMTVMPHERLTAEEALAEDWLVVNRDVLATKTLPTEDIAKMATVLNETTATHLFEELQRTFSVYHRQEDVLRKAGGQPGNQSVIDDDGATLSSSKSEQEESYEVNELVSASFRGVIKEHSVGCFVPGLYVRCACRSVSQSYHCVCCACRCRRISWGSSACQRRVCRSL